MIVFTVLRVRLIRPWRLRALLPLQLLCVAGSLLLLRSRMETSVQMLFAVLIGPAALTLPIYLCGWLIARAAQRSPLVRS